MTSADLLPARVGGGPTWHGYPRPCPDLLFVVALYAVGFGVSVCDPKIAEPAHLAGAHIAVPPRPSAVRLLAEALLHDGWGLEGKIALIDMTPTEAGKALATGDVEATVWNLVVPGTGGMLDPLLPHGTRFLPVDSGALDRVHLAHAFRLARIVVAGVPMLSFAQGLSAWRESDAATVGAVLNHIASGLSLPGFPRTVSAMRDWPGLDAAAIHPAALDWYRGRGAA